MNKWHYLYKIDYVDLTECTTNLLYAPVVSSSGKIMSKIFDGTNAYHKGNGVSKELTDFFFEREVKYLEIFQRCSWAPSVLDINSNTKTVTIEFNTETLNHIIMDSTRSLDQECPDWKDQIWNILKEIDSMGYYKLALYPHCFFLKDGNIKTIDFYSCIEKDNCLMERNKLEGIIGKDSSGRFNDATDGDYVNFQKFFKITLTEFLGKMWKDNPFPNFYNKLYD
jgi:hypothetical protein